MVRRNAVPALLTLMFIALVLFTAWSLNHFRRYQPYAALLAQSEFGPRQFALQLTDVEMRGRSGGSPQWSVHAREIRLMPDQTSITIDSLEHGVLMRDAKPYLRFVAATALYALGGSPNAGGTVQVAGGIHIDSVGPTAPLNAPISIATEQAFWNGYRSILTLPGQVHISFSRTSSSPGIVLGSQGANWNAANHQLTCPAHVQANVDSLGSYGPYRVESTGLIYDEPAGQVRCQNPISVTIPGLGNATCRPLVLDIRRHTADLGLVHIVADASSVLPPMPTPAPAAPPASSHAAASTPADDNKVTIDAPQGWHWDEQNRIGTARGPVAFHQGDTTMTTVGGVYNRKTDIATALSPVTITDPDTTINGNKGTVNFKTHDATLAGSVNVDVEPKPEKSDSADDDDVKQPSTMTCDAIDYDYKKKFAVTTGTVTIKQTVKQKDDKSAKDVHRTVIADHGTYDAVKKYAELTGNVVYDSDDGQHMEADLAKISLKKGEEWVDVPVPKVITLELKPEDNPKSSK